MSLILYHDEDQKRSTEISLKKETIKRNQTLTTEIASAGIYYPAEDYHQNNRLQEHAWLVKELGLTPELLQTSHIAARLNNYLVGVGSDALYGAQPGVLRNRVGYSGGTALNPEYQKLGEHTEVIEIDYDPKIISYEDLLEFFWNNHEYGLTTTIKKQYMSLILYHDEDQKRTAKISLKKETNKRNQTLTTEIASAGIFYPAEDF